MTARAGGGKEGGGAERGDGDGPALGTVLARLRQQFATATGARVERVSALRRIEEGWQGSIDIVELERIPPTTDVLATYAVWTDARGKLLSFERVRRFLRSEGGGGA